MQTVHCLGSQRHEKWGKGLCQMVCKFDITMCLGYISIYIV